MKADIEKRVGKASSARRGGMPEKGRASAEEEGGASKEGRALAEGEGGTPVKEADSVLETDGASAAQANSAPTNMDSYERFLRDQGLAPGTVRLYVRVASDYLREFGDPSREGASRYRDELVSRCKPATVNLRVNALNRFLAYEGMPECRVGCVQVQRRSYLEGVISAGECQRLGRMLLEHGHMTYYFAVRVLASTGLRVSELLELTVRDVRAGRLDVVSKGGKARRVFIPSSLCAELGRWLAKEGRAEGYVFLNARGGRITARGLSGQLKVLAERYGIDPSVVYPHSFRHLFARSFLDAREDIALLADLMGHSSIETTRIYLRRTASEQRAVVEEVVTW